MYIILLIIFSIPENQTNNHDNNKEQINQFLWFHQITCQLTEAIINLPTRPLSYIHITILNFRWFLTDSYQLRIVCLIVNF